MDKIERTSPNLLSDTLNLVQIARESALQRGIKKQADQLEPVVEQLQSLVQKETSSAEPSGIMAQDDFKTLLDVSNSTTDQATKTTSAGERNQMVSAMSAGGMSDLEIARQLGMTRDEVKLVINLSNMNVMSRR